MNNAGKLQLNPIFPGSLIGALHKLKEARMKLMQPMIRFLLWVTLVIALPCHQLAQEYTQTVKGRVQDRVSRQPLAGATVRIAETGISIVSVSDTTGFFELKRVPVGRRQVECSILGYATFISDNIEVNSAKEVELVIEMEEQIKSQQEIIIRSRLNPKRPVNQLSVVSTRSFSPEETQRFAASASDPGRMAMGFPGVQPSRDTRSDIIIRGNSPAGMQWRLEGVDVINPNHFARKGSSGGGITIFSTSMLDNSDFSTSAFPAEYGDALSGIFDMRFRKGNDEKKEFTFKAGLIGLDFSAEGPFKKESSSYLFNYRYSTLGILNKLGISLVDERESNTFQDISFNLNFTSKNKTSSFNIWGIGGISEESYDAVEDTSDWKQYDDYAIYDFDTKMAAVGVGHVLKSGKRSFLKSTIAVIAQTVTYTDDTLNTQKVPSRINNEVYDNNRIVLASSFSLKLNQMLSMKTGITLSWLFYRFNQDKLDFPTGNYGNVINGDGNAAQLQAFWLLNWKPYRRLTVNSGLHFLYLGLNQTSSMEPRVSVQYRLTNNQHLSLAYGLHGKVLPLGSYFYRDSATGAYPNSNLSVMHSHHYVAAYDWLMGKNWRFHIEAYYQALRKIPVANDPARTFWLLNQIEGYANEGLVSLGKGTNKGIDITIEHFFSKSFFLLTSFSFFSSTYKPLNGVSYNTQYNSSTTGSIVGTKEWNLKRNRIFQLGWKFLHNGGLPTTPLAAVQNDDKAPVLDEAAPYSIKVPAYYRTDARLALRKNKTGVSWILALDIQNVTGRENTDALSRRYDPSTNQWVYKKQSGIVPVLSYQLDF